MVQCYVFFFFVCEGNVLPSDSLTIYSSRANKKCKRESVWERESEREQEKKENQSIAHRSKSNIRSRVNYIQDFHSNNKSNNSTDTTQSIP